MGGGSSVFIAVTRWGAGMTLGTPRMTMRGNSNGWATKSSFRLPEPRIFIVMTKRGPAAFRHT